MSRSRLLAGLAAGAMVMLWAGLVHATVTSLTPLATYDAGENIVSYYEYLALDCPDAAACQFHKTITTVSRNAHIRAAAVVTGFKLWTALPEKIGRVEVTVFGSKTGVGAVDLTVRGDFAPGSPGQLFSYRIVVAIIESTIEGFTLTDTAASCPIGHCPVSVVVPAAAPPGHRFIGFALRGFNSDRKFRPLFGARVLLTASTIDPTTGDVSATLSCGTIPRPGGLPADLSGPCESQWVAIAAPLNSVAGGPTGLPLLPGPATATGFSGGGVNLPNPSTTSPSQFCLPHPQASKGFLDAVAGFHILAGSFTAGVYHPATKGGTYSLDVSVTGLGFGPAAIPIETFTNGLLALDPAPPMPPVPAPLSYMRLNTSLCL